MSATLAWLFGGCGGADVTIAITHEAGQPPSFADPDAGIVAVPEAGLLSYCPSNKCPTGRTTCPTSRFACDVDLRTDRKNCGGCGVVCPTETNRETYECVEGRCVLQCSAVPRTLDCDGASDNGCELDPNGDDNCGACGNECLDPAKPCVDRSGGVLAQYGCGCLDGDLLCPPGRCLDPRRDDSNCGACGNACDPTADGGALYPNMYYGCVDRQCGRFKCKEGYDNCDRDGLNGCETDLRTSENCGACGNACPAGQECKLNRLNMPECMCPEGKTYCPFNCFGGTCLGSCIDLSTDREHCGACGRNCGVPPGATSIGTCVSGMCIKQCSSGRADCNGDEADECEVNTDSDPRNCGACGRVCDAIAGQACVGGECVVEPCHEGDEDGGIPR